MGKNSLSAKQNSLHPVNVSLLRNLEINIEKDDKRIGINNNMNADTPFEACPNITPSFIQYMTSIQEVVFRVRKNLNNKFIKFPPNNS